MPSSVETFFNSVRDWYQTESADTATVWEYGAANVARAWGGDARVVCVRERATLEPLSRAARAAVGGNPTERRMAYGLRASINWYLWAPTEELVEALLGNVVVSIISQTASAVETVSIDTVEWPSEISQAVSDLPHAILGTVVVYELSADLVALPQKAITSTSHTGLFGGQESC